MKQPPLNGVRIIEHGQLLAVPFAARLLSDLGAEIIKVESPVRLDSHRQTTYPDNEPGERFWDRGGTFYNENRGKLGITLDLRYEAARHVFRRLVAVSDVVMENFTTRVMHNFGLDYEALREIKHDLIMLSSTGYGHTGPWANYRAVGPTTEAASGVAAVTGYIDGPPVLAEIPYTDYVAAEQGVLSILLALFRRRRTGEGGFIDLSQIESQAALGGELFLDAASNGDSAAPRGNRHPAMAPHGFFPCAAPDSWIAIAVNDDTVWQRLQVAMGSPAWAADPRLATLDGRMASVDEIEERLAEWTSNQDAMSLMYTLQEHGVAAGVALNGRDLVLNEHFEARGFWDWLEHPPETGIAPKPYPAVPWRFSESQRGERRRAPMLGEHNYHVLCDLLGYSREQVDELAASGALGGDPSEFPKPAPVSLQALMADARVLDVDEDYQVRLEELHGRSS